MKNTMIYELNSLFGGFAEIKDVNNNQVVSVANNKLNDYFNIRKDLGIFPMTFTSYYKISGKEAGKKLDFLLTKSVRNLNCGHNCMCYFLEESGEISAIVTLYKNDNNFIIEAFNWDAQKIETIFHANEISFEKLNNSCILLEGIQAADFLLTTTGLFVNYFAHQSHKHADCFCKNIMVARTGYTGELGYKLIGSEESVITIWKNILPEYKNNIVGYDALEMCHYESKQPFWELPYLSVSKNPFELDYHWLVNFNKDTDYVGKNALLNIKFAEMQKKIIGSVCKNESAVGDEVLLENDIIGKVIDSRLSYGLGKYITMLFVEKEYAHANINMDTATGQKLTTISAPYVFPESR